MIIGCQQNKLNPQWDYLIKFLSLDLANWSIYVETGESCCLKWSFSLTLSEIPWCFSSILPNVKISLTLCKIPWQFPDLEKFYFSLTFPWRLWTLTSDNFVNNIWLNENETMISPLLIKRRYWYHCCVLRRQFTNITIRQVTITAT